MKKFQSILNAFAVMCAFAINAMVENDFNHRIPITVSGWSGSQLANFPVAVRVSAGNPTGFSYADAAQDGSDIRFMLQDGTVLSYEIDTWDTAGESLVWVKLPALKNGAAFTMLYGAKNPQSLPASDPTQVWTEYVGVWHMNEANGDVADATGHGLTARVMGASTITNYSIKVDGATVPTGIARQTGTSSVKGYLSVPSYDSFGLGANFAISGWVKLDSHTGYPRVFSRKNSYTSNNGWETELSSGTAMTVRGASNDKKVDVTLSPALVGTWGQIGLEFSGSTATVWSNGKPLKSGSVNTPTDNNLPLSFGCDSDGDETYVRGDFDEVRLRSAAPLDWIKAEYDSVHNHNFLTLSAAAETMPFSVTAADFGLGENGYEITATLTDGTCDIAVALTPLGGLANETVLRTGATAGAYTNVVAAIPAGAAFTAALRFRNGAKVLEWPIEGTFLNEAAYEMSGRIPVAYTVNETLSDFPVAVRLKNGTVNGFSLADLGANGAGVRFTDAHGRYLTHDIDTWPADPTDALAEALIWVKKTLAAGDELRMYYGGSNPLTNNPAAVWSSYVGVWHTNEASGDVADATGHGLTATAAGDVAETPGISVATADAPTGMGRQTATNYSNKGYLSVPSYDSLGLAARFTVTGWVKMTETSGYPRLFSRKDSYTPNNGWETEAGQNSYTTTTMSGAGNNKTAGATLSSTQNTRRHVGITCLDTTVTAYSDGVQKNSGTVDLPTDNGLPLSIGCNSNGSDSHIVGGFDEVRLMRGAADATWMAAEFASVSDPDSARLVSVEATFPAKVESAALRESEGTLYIDLTLTGSAADISTIVTPVGGSQMKTLYQASVAPGTYATAVPNPAVDAVSDISTELGIAAAC